MTRYNLELLCSDESHPSACAMLETGAISIRRTNKPFFKTPVDWNLDQVRDLFHVYLNKCEFHFSRLHVNKINNFCFHLNNGGVPGMTKETNMQFKA